MGCGHQLRALQQRKMRGFLGFIAQFLQHCPHNIAQRHRVFAQRRQPHIDRAQPIVPPGPHLFHESSRLQFAQHPVHCGLVHTR